MFEKMKRRYHLGDHGEDGRIILKLVFTKYGGKLWVVFTWFKVRLAFELLSLRLLTRGFYMKLGCCSLF